MTKWLKLVTVYPLVLAAAAGAATTAAVNAIKATSAIPRTQSARTSQASRCWPNPEPADDESAWQCNRCDSPRSGDLLRGLGLL